METLLAVGVVVVIVGIGIALAFLPKENKDSKKKSEIKKLTRSIVEEFPQDLLSMAYYYVDRDLCLRKATEESEELTESGKVVVSTSKLNNMVEIPDNIPGKLLEINEDEIRIQFGSDTDKSLVFVLDEKDSFKLSVDENSLVAYDKLEYKADSQPEVLFKLKKRFNEKTVSRREKGAW